MGARDPSEFVSSATWRRTSRGTLWRALVLSCWEAEEMTERLGKKLGVRVVGNERDSYVNRLMLAGEGARYWGLLAVRKELEEGWPEEP